MMGEKKRDAKQERERRLRRLLDPYSAEAMFIDSHKDEAVRERRARALGRHRCGFGERLKAEIDAMRMVRSAAFKKGPFIWGPR